VGHEPLPGRVVTGEPTWTMPCVVHRIS
jgi:hypothetical protein